MHQTVLAPCLLLVGEVASENLATFAVSGLGKFITEGGAITKKAVTNVWINPIPLLVWEP